MTSLLDKVMSLRLARTLGANALGRAFLALGPLLLVPLFLHRWGSAGYGEWLLIATIPGYLMSFGDFGLPTVAANEMTMTAGRGDRVSTLATFQSAWAFVVVVTSCVLGGLLTVLWTLPLEGWVRLGSLSTLQLRVTISILMGGVAVSQQTMLAGAGLRCAGGFSFQAVLNSTFAAITLISQGIALALDGSPVAVAGGMLASNLTALSISVIQLRLRVPWLSWGFAHADWKRVRRLLRPAVSYVVIALRVALSVQGVVTALGLSLGPVAVASFSTVRTMTNATRQLMTLVNVSVWPEITQSYGAGDLDRARRLHRGAVAASFWLGIGILLFLGVLGPAIYAMWVGDEVAFNGPLFYTMIAAAFAALLGTTSSVVHVAVNRHTELALVGIVASTAVVAAAFLLAPHWGVVVVGAAFCVVEGLSGAWIVKHSVGLLGDDLAEFLGSVARAPRRIPELIARVRT